MKSNKIDMYSKFNLIIATVTLLALFNFTACSDSNSTGSDNDGETPGSQATINGQVEDDLPNHLQQTRQKMLREPL